MTNNPNTQNHSTRKNDIWLFRQSFGIKMLFVYLVAGIAIIGIGSSRMVSNTESESGEVAGVSEEISESDHDNYNKLLNANKTIDDLNAKLDEKDKEIKSLEELVDKLENPEEGVDTDEENTDTLEKEEVNNENIGVNFTGYIDGSCEFLKQNYGMGNFQIGDPNYTSYRDLDMNGVACEFNTEEGW